MRALVTTIAFLFALPAFAGESESQPAPAPAPAQPAFEFAPPAFSPSFGLHGGWRTRPGLADSTEGTFPVWLGMTLHPSPSRSSSFISFGLEIAHVSFLARNGIESEYVTYTEWVPEMRTGFAWRRAPYTRWYNLTWPNFQVYGIAGYRMRNEEVSADGALRLGLGISSPFVTGMGAAHRGVPVPTSIEVIMDVESADRPPQYGFRIGWYF